MDNTYDLPSAQEASGEQTQPSSPRTKGPAGKVAISATLLCTLLLLAACTSAPSTSDVASGEAAIPLVGEGGG